ncbi:Core-2/I-Branching enzyme [Pedobacter terrae]|uniref:Peptide O-xylosyltransferase n=1 Tax=Pedobacter terrae TaxID=405671 RepID=A0A1G8CKB6_9SPHI|nr:beta-1,6-N-acetylglucosaminyltransferase [Pedobacter terrae]SDH45759.1 Core-2/I-Branching enzyme [Pedobacter terrae]
MHITYIILAHKNPKQLLRLVRALSCEKTFFVIHIDFYSDIKNFIEIFTERDLLRVHFIPKRSMTSWGSFAIVEATLTCFHYVHTGLTMTTRIILLSGQDYPIKNNKYIRSYLEFNNNSIFLNYNKIPYDKWVYGGKLRFPCFEIITEQIEIYCGSQWFSLPFQVLGIIFEFLEFNPDFITYYKAVDVPDESFFQTLLLNCDDEFVKENLVNRNLHLIKWDSPYMHPRVLEKNAMKLIKRSRYLFARKFDGEQPSVILDKIDSELLSTKKELAEF